MEREPVVNNQPDLRPFMRGRSVDPSDDRQLAMVWCCLQWKGPIATIRQSADCKMQCTERNRIEQSIPDVS